MFAETTDHDVGYCLAEPGGGFAFPPPRTVFETRDRPLGVRAVQNCPAVNALERLLVEIPCPVSLRLALEEDADGPALSVIERGTFVEAHHLERMLALEPPERWRDPTRPVLQLTLPWFLVTDTPAMINLMPPFLAAGIRRWPGTCIAARWPLTVWPQTLTWAFEWDRRGEPLVLQQGEPLALALFEFNRPDARPRLVEAALTEELAEYRRQMQNIHHITPEIEEVWRSAAARRPERLLVPLAEADDG